jgi:hypothetical protein
VQITNLADGGAETLAADTTGTAITASYNSGTLLLTGNDSPANYQNVLRTVTYHNASQNPTAGDRRLTFVATDGNEISNTATATVTVQPVNDPPQLLRNQALSVDEGASAVIASALLAVTDVDNPPSALLFTIVSGPARGSILLGGSATGSFTQADIDGDAVRYVHDGSETVADQFTFHVADGSGGTIGDTVFAINVAAVNDPPIHAVPGPQSTNKNTPLVFSAAQGNALTISDVDAGSQAVQTQLIVTGGVATVGTSGVTVTGNGTGNVTITGPISAISTALNGLVFQPIASFVGAANLRIVTNDQGHTGSGGPRSDTDDIAIQVVEPPVGQPHVQVGSLFLSSGDGWRTIALPDPHAYASMVVVVTTNYDRFAPALVPRVRNAAGRSFELKLESLNPSSPITPGVRVYYVVMEEGVYTQAQHGVTLEARKVVANITDRAGSWQAQVGSYQNSYQNPVVIGQVMSANDANWSVFWSRGAAVGDPPSTSTLRIGKHVGEDPNKTRVAETVGYFVIEAGTGTLGSLRYVAGLGGDTVLGVDNAPPYTYGLAPFLAEADGAVLSQAGMDGGNGSWAMLYGQAPLTASQLRLAVDEDQKNDAERVHTDEQVAYFVWDGPGAGNFGSSGGSSPGGGGGNAPAFPRQLDVSRDGIIGPHDMVLVLSHLVKHGSRDVRSAMSEMNDDQGWTADMLDTDGNQLIQPADIAWIAQHLARRGSTADSPTAGGEGESARPLANAATPLDAWAIRGELGAAPRRQAQPTRPALADEANTDEANTDEDGQTLLRLAATESVASTVETSSPRRSVFGNGRPTSDWEQSVDAVIAEGWPADGGIADESGASWRMSR